MRSGLWLALAAAFSLSLPAWQGAARDERVLFIGNSLTSFNDLPSIVERLARADGRRLTATTIAVNDFGLEEHWHQSEARRRIAAGGWTTVVRQQGPSALPASRVLLIDYAKRFDTEIRRAGARTALYMVWPASSRRGDFAGVSASYRAAAAAIGAVILPAGDAWQAAWRRDPALALYGPDAFHPSGAGSFLAALVVVEGLTSTAVSPAAADDVARSLRLDAASVATLRAAAADVRARRHPAHRPGPLSVFQYSSTSTPGTRR